MSLILLQVKDEDVSGLCAPGRKGRRAAGIRYQARAKVEGRTEATLSGISSSSIEVESPSGHHFFGKLRKSTSKMLGLRRPSISNSCVHRKLTIKSPVSFSPRVRGHLDPAIARCANPKPPLNVRSLRVDLCARLECMPTPAS